MAARRQSSENFLRQFRDSTEREFSSLTAAELLAVWQHYDRDRNGFIEGDELDRFLVELVSSSCRHDVSGMVVSDTMLQELRKDVLDAYDENGDGKLELRELAELLPTDENFLLLFQMENQFTSSVDFMKIWRTYDQDQNGYIDSRELKLFLKELIHRSAPNAHVSQEKINEYALAILQVFDDNGDGQLQLNEMTRLLPLKDAVLSDTVGKFLFKDTSQLSYNDIERVFGAYDADGNGTIEKDEVTALAKDLLDIMKPTFSIAELQHFETMMLRTCDLDGDGQICKEELTVFLLGLQKFTAKD